MVVDRYNIEFHHIFTENPCKTNEIHAKPMEITIGFPIGTEMESSRPKKLGGMNHFGNRFQIG